MSVVLNGVTLQLGDVVVTSGTRQQWRSRLLMWAMNSMWTHVFIVGPNDTMLESSFPHGVRISSLADRVASLQHEERAAHVLRYPGLTAADALVVATTAANMRGRKYDVLQAILYGLFRHFIKDGPLRLICSRYVTASYADDAGIDLFPVRVLDERAGRANARYAELRKGWCAPQDFLDYAVLQEARPDTTRTAA